MESGPDMDIPSESTCAMVLGMLWDMTVLGDRRVKFANKFTIPFSSWLLLPQVIALFALALSRGANIWLCSRAINLLRPPEMSVPESHQVYMQGAL